MQPLRKKFGFAKPAKSQPQTARTRPPRQKGTPTKPEPPPDVTFECGHTRCLGYFSKKPCPDCAHRKQQEQLEKEKAERHEAQKRKAREARQWRTRLPNNSTFTLIFDADSVRWTGVLKVKIGDAERTFTKSARAVFLLMQHLDRAYRRARNRYDRENPNDDGTRVVVPGDRVTLEGISKK